MLKKVLQTEKLSIGNTEQRTSRPRNCIAPLMQFLGLELRCTVFPMESFSVFNKSISIAEKMKC